ncbi:hypothetical protein SKAU_G00095940 [Synaphobranchus kaupii]|uniref:PiggyBac transposable element-derived protein domain-containing protein n=1 Tax=Synaphobranchus kaupii TaxID=118154 RepID=A0A9Q1FXN2_SYNKA|nr:hypothetical protein SKAU_G00095940 [Synaphobranchus kaupii]
MARSACPPAKRRASAPAPSTTEPQDSWRCVTQPDTEPLQFPFCPVRIPGPQLDTTKSYSPLELFQLFFSDSVVKTACDNTNKNRLYKLAFTESVMPRGRFEAITWTLHMSDPVEDAHNDQKRGSHWYDRLFRLRPLLDEIVVACKAFYHPHQALFIDERMIASKNRIGLKQYMTAEWGFKLFVLANAHNSHTCNYNIYQGKLFTATGKGLSFDAVVDLLDVAHLGTGCHIYVDNFYTSAALSPPPPAALWSLWDDSSEPPGLSPRTEWYAEKSRREPFAG